jgi:hypothetical protein
MLLLSREQLDRIKPDFPLSQGVPRADDLVLRFGVGFVYRLGLGA